MLVVVNLSLGATPGAAGLAGAGMVGAGATPGTPPMPPALGAGIGAFPPGVPDTPGMPGMPGVAVGGLARVAAGAGVGVTLGAGGFSPGYPGNSLTLFEAFSSSFLDFSSSSCNSVVRVVT